MGGRNGRGEMAMGRPASRRGGKAFQRNGLLPWDVLAMEITLRKVRIWGQGSDEKCPSRPTVLP